MHSSPYGPAGGGLAGAYPNPTVVGDGASANIAARVFGPRTPAAAAASAAVAGSRYHEPTTDGDVTNPQIIFFDGDFVFALSTLVP